MTGARTSLQWEADRAECRPQPTEAVEAYRSPAEVPVEYNITRSGDQCGVLLFWTKH